MSNQLTAQGQSKAAQLNGDRAEFHAAAFSIHLSHLVTGHQITLMPCGIVKSHYARDMETSLGGLGGVVGTPSRQHT